MHRIFFSAARMNSSTNFYPDLSEVWGYSLTFSYNKLADVNKNSVAPSDGKQDTSSSVSPIGDYNSSKPEPWKSHFQVGNDVSFYCYGAVRSIDKAANMQDDQFGNQHTKRKEKHMINLIRFLLSKPEQHKELTQVTKAPDDSSCIRFFQVLSSDKTSAKETWRIVGFCAFSNGLFISRGERTWVNRSLQVTWRSFLAWNLMCFVWNYFWNCSLKI